MLRVFRPSASSCLQLERKSQTTTHNNNGAKRNASKMQEEEKKEEDDIEDIPVTVLRWLSDRVVLVAAPCREDAQWVLKFSHNKDPEDITSWNESALQRLLFNNEPEHIVPPALDSDYVVALIGRQKAWRAVKATLYIPKYMPRPRNKVLTVDAERQLQQNYDEAVQNIKQILAQSPHTTDTEDMDWACCKKNVIRPSAEAFLFHDFDHNVR